MLAGYVIYNILFFWFCSWREEMVKNVQIATVLYEVLKTLVLAQNIEEKVHFSYHHLNWCNISKHSRGMHWECYFIFRQKDMLQMLRTRRDNMSIIISFRYMLLVLNQQSWNIPRFVCLGQALSVLSLMIFTSWNLTF